MTTIDNWDNYDIVFLLTFLHICVSIWESLVLSFITINDNFVRPYLSFTINLNMASIASGSKRSLNLVRGF